jgi:hypothetical protein
MTMTRAWIWVAAAVLLSVAGAAAADDKPSGTVAIESTSVALGIGVSWGDGKLNYLGTTHAFSVKGLSVVDVGVSKVSARGKVYHLTKLGDFPGNFTAVQAGATVGGGASAVALRNQNGVVLELTSTQTGVKFTLAGEGIEVKLK